MKQINEDILIAEKYTLIKEAAKKTAHSPNMKYLQIDCCRGDLDYDDGEMGAEWDGTLFDRYYIDKDTRAYYEEFTHNFPSFKDLLYQLNTGQVVDISSEEGTTYYGTDLDYIKTIAAEDNYCGYSEVYEEEVLLKKQKEVKDAISKNDQSGWDL